MDSIHAFDSSEGPCVDREGRCALHLSPVCAARLSPYSWGGALVALHQCLWVHYHRIDLCDVALRNRAMEKDCAYLGSCTDTSLEYVRPLCHRQSAAGTECFLRIQCASATSLFRCSLDFWTTFDFDRDRNVACIDESLSLVSAIVWRPAVSALHSLHSSARLHSVPRRPHHAGGLDR